MYNYPYYWQNMQQCNLITSQFYSLQSQNANCMQRANEACTNVAFRARQQRLEDIRESYKDFPKSCFNCKHKRYGFYNLSEGSCEMFSDPYYCIRMRIYSNRKYWEPDNRAADLIGLKVKAQEADDEISELKNRLELLRIQQLKANIAATHKEPPKPEKKYTVYDLYELVFPDDPIKAHFDAVRKEIEEKYKPQEEIVEKISVPDMPNRHTEPIQTVTYDDDMMTVPQAVAFWIGAIAFVMILILT